MQLVNKENDLSGGIFDLLQHRLQTVLEFATILRACKHGAQVEGDNALILQDLGDIAGYDAASESFDNRRFTYARFADEYWIVLRAPGKNLNHTTNFFIPPNDGIEFPFSGQFSEVLGIALQCLVFGLGILVSHFL